MMSTAQVLFFRQEHNRRALSEIIKALDCNFILFEEEPIEPGDGIITTDIQQQVDSLVDLYTGEGGIDFIVTCCHNGNPAMEQIQQRIKPRVGCYDIEHDLYSDIYESSPKAQHLASFAFTAQNQRYLESQGRNYFNAIWYKFPAWPMPEDVMQECKRSAVYVDEQYLVKRNVPFQYLDLFDRVYHKPCNLGDDNAPILRGMIKDVEAWDDSHAMYQLGDMSLFWFSGESSAIVEALLMNRLPILLFDKGERDNGLYTSEVTEEPVDDILSKVSIKSQFIDRRTMYAITETNAAHKIQVLQQDDKRRADVLKVLRNQWLPVGELRPVQELLVNDIKRMMGGV